MEDNNINQPITHIPPPKNAWYKTGGGVAFLGVISVIILFAVVFLGFVIYYSWQIKYGDAEELSLQFNTGKFSQDPGLAGVGLADTEEKNINNYIRDFNPVWGGVDKPVTIIAFIDFECPYSLESYPIFEKIRNKYEPMIRVVFKHLPLQTIHPNAVLSANASSCAAEQGKFWEYYTELFKNINHDEPNLISLADEVGLDIQSFTTCFESEKYVLDINKDLMDAVNLGLIGTPTYFINGYKVEGVLDEVSWGKLILQIYNK